MSLLNMHSKHLFCMPDRVKGLHGTLDMCFDMVSITFIFPPLMLTKKSSVVKFHDNHNK